MALVRCEDCNVKPLGSGRYTRNYVTHVFPVGHPHSAIVCGKPSCKKPGLIWLEEKETKAYNKGERIFSLQTATIKVRAQ